METDVRKNEITRQCSKKITLTGLTLGDPWNKKSWSGSNYGLFTALKSSGVLVGTHDVDLYGLHRKWRILQSLALDMNKWRFKFHLNTDVRRDRSKIAFRALRNKELDFNCILQIGSEFGFHEYDEMKHMPMFSYHDSNLHFLLKSPLVKPPLSLEYIERALDYERAVYDRMDLIFTMSEFLRQCFIDDFNVNPQKVFVVGAGFNFDYIEEKEKVYDRRTILFVARHLFEQKGGKLLLEAFRKVRQEIPDARLVIVGIDLGIREEGIENYGFIDKNNANGYKTLKEIYERASVYAMPSYYDAFGIVFLEAMAHKIPCIGANCCAMPEIIKDNNAGYVINPGNIQELAERLVELLKNEDLMKVMGLNGYNAIQEKYTWGVVGKKILDKIDDFMTHQF